MKKVLVTGKSGYIGSKFKEWIEINGKDIKLDYISVRDDSWRSKDFSQYDTVLHLAGIAHVSRNPKLKDMYYKINRDLTIELSKKAKIDKVNQFIFMSSIIVYGDSQYINNETETNPKDFYGQSKLEAENGLLKVFNNGDSKLAIVRIPMVYGKGSKGNYKILSKFANKTPIFPDYENKRSMIYIENLFEFLFIVINKSKSGIFHPQNEHYISTKQLIVEISSINNKNIKLYNSFNQLIKMLVNHNNIFKKIFGDMYYDKNLSKVDFEYNLINFKKSIELTEKEEKN